MRFVDWELFGYRAPLTHSWLLGPMAMFAWYRFGAMIVEILPEASYMRIVDRVLFGYRDPLTQS